MIPIRAITLVTLTAGLLGLVNIGSPIAFNALNSLALIGHYTTYLLPITLLFLRRFGKKEIPWGPWTLGRWGLPINLFSMAYSILLIVFMVFPPYQPVRAENMNYASVIFGAAILVSTVLWFVYGRKTYGGPVREVIEDFQIKDWLRGGGTDQSFVLPITRYQMWSLFERWGDGIPGSMVQLSEELATGGSMKDMESAQFRRCIRMPKSIARALYCVPLRSLN